MEQPQLKDLRSEWEKVKNDKELADYFFEWV